MKLNEAAQLSHNFEAVGRTQKPHPSFEGSVDSEEQGELDEFQREQGIDRTVGDADGRGLSTSACDDGSDTERHYPCP